MSLFPFFIVFLDEFLLKTNFAFTTKISPLNLYHVLNSFLSREIDSGEITIKSERDPSTMLKFAHR